MEFQEKFQSTRPRGARRRAAGETHARTRRFNPRAREGRDAILQNPQTRLLCFNPRAREGRDSETFPRDAATPLVSIHAPARGATVCVMSCELPFPLFQSTRPRGARLSFAQLMTNYRCFNPRAREGRDRVERPVETAAASFNPRAREGRDVTLLGRLGKDPVSIHAPARGATSAMSGSRAFPRCFNPRAREGRDLAILLTRIRETVSIHAPARGATLKRPRFSK